MNKDERTLDDLLEEDAKLDAEDVMRELRMEAHLDEPPQLEDTDESLKL